MRFNFNMVHFVSYVFNTDAEVNSWLETLVSCGMISEYAYVHHPEGLHCEASHYHICLRQKREGVIFILSFANFLFLQPIKGTEIDLFHYLSRYDCKVISNFDFYKALKQ